MSNYSCQVTMTGTVGEPTVSYGHFLTGDGNCKAADVEDGDICAAGRTYVRYTRSCERSCALTNTPKSLHHTSCPAGWSYFGCRCYKHVTKSLSWAEARDNCRDIAVPDNGGDLASVDSAELHQFLTTVLVAGTSEGASYLGGVREGGAWRWSDGTRWQFTRWAEHQPSGDGSHIQMADFNGKWDDIGGSFLRYLRFLYYNHSMVP